MDYSWKKGFGISLIIVGVFIVLIGKAITGAVIGFSSENYLSLLGIIVFVVGIALMFEGRRGEGDLVRIIRTKKFEKAIKGHEAEIQNALAKLGTPLGHPHALSNGELSMSTSKGGRIIYEENAGEYTLKNYTPDHDYKRAM